MDPVFRGSKVLSGHVPPIPPSIPSASPESFGCKHRLIPGAELLPQDPVVDSRVLPGWTEVPVKDGKNRTLESLVIKGSTVVYL